MAYDTAAPTQISYANVTIDVNRNPNAPQFRTQVYDPVIPENYDLGRSLVQLEATDGDGVSMGNSTFGLDVL
jgi:hypothetical protein